LTGSRLGTRRFGDLHSTYDLSGLLARAAGRDRLQFHCMVYRVSHSLTVNRRTFAIAEEGRLSLVLLKGCGLDLGYPSATFDLSTV
jgi:hypothetical protein